MTITIEAVYENGVFRPKQPLALTEGTEARVTISQAQEECDPLEAVIGIGDSGRTDGADPLAGLIGTFSSGRTDGAANHDKYIYGDPHS